MKMDCATTLTWRGPYPLENLKDELSPEDKQEAKEHGVYLYCLEREGRYHVFYIGAAPKRTILERLEEERRDYTGHHSSLVDINSFAKDGKLDVVWINDYDMGEPDADLIETNIGSSRIFFAAAEHPVVIEGALQVHFWRTMETRKYLLTQKISNWKYRGTIYNRGKIDHIHGLTSIIDLKQRIG